MNKKKKKTFKNEATSGLKVKSCPYESHVTKFSKEEKEEEDEEQEKKRSWVCHHHGAAATLFQLRAFPHPQDVAAVCWEDTSALVIVISRAVILFPRDQKRLHSHQRFPSPSMRPSQIFAENNVLLNMTLIKWRIIMTFSHVRNLEDLCRTFRLSSFLWLYSKKPCIIYKC